MRVTCHYDLTRSIIDMYIIRIFIFKSVYVQFFFLSMSVSRYTHCSVN
jgi:hypothetical protein